MNSDNRFAVFIDDTLRSYQVSGSFRSALHAEAPGARGAVTICPPEHRHGVTATCYGSHGCRCEGCRAASSVRQRRAYLARSVARWADRGRTA